MKIFIQGGALLGPGTAAVGGGLRDGGAAGSKFLARRGALTDGATDCEDVVGAHGVVSLPVAGALGGSWAGGMGVTWC